MLERKRLVRATGGKHFNRTMSKERGGWLRCFVCVEFINFICFHRDFSSNVLCDGENNLDSRSVDVISHFNVTPFSAIYEGTHCVE